jgi:hypothetical protein
MTEKSSSGPGNGVISVPTLISMAAVLFMAFGGGWTLFQSQFTAMVRQIDELKQLDGFRLDGQKQQIVALEHTVRDDLQTVFIPRREFGEFQKRFEALAAEIDRLQTEQHAFVLTAARHPIEKETLDVIDADFGKRIDQIEVQIQDINRQIAAALIIIDNQKIVPSKTTSPP